MIDVFSKYVTFDSVKKPTATVLWRKLERRIQHLGKPSAVLCDQGTQFTAKFWRKTLKDNDIKLIVTSVRHPQPNPVERSMRELSRLCRAYCQLNHRSWAQQLNRFADWINCAYHESTERTPHELQFGERPRDALQELFERRGAEVESGLVEADAIVKKFINVYEGPYVIKEVVQTDVFILAYPNHNKQRGMFHINLLKPFVTPNTTGGNNNTNSISSTNNNSPSNVNTNPSSININPNNSNNFINSSNPIKTNNSNSNINNFSNHLYSNTNNTHFNTYSSRNKPTPSSNNSNSNINNINHNPINNIIKIYSNNYKPSPTNNSNHNFTSNPSMGK
ncbi:putative uncharacterized protein DDB_G0282133 [Culex quinquefasciatus]|uniref:putative uncharacterized protein DDB_G0282133 n=1 Tax=Culex quinquefasciatus TaxID=7176 RepID=UPI0018E29AD5|nr:putative uncharacterized protein DDB_G0282133 [Culex quinquefasciatus]